MVSNRYNVVENFGKISTAFSGLSGTRTAAPAAETINGILELASIGAVGLYYYGARYYDPVAARFITPDSIVPSATTRRC